MPFTTYKPLVIINGQVQQLSTSDGLEVENLTVGSNMSITGDFSTTGTITTSTAPITIGAWALGPPTADNQVLQATAANVASWTTDLEGLTSLVVDNMTFNGAQIQSNTGAISFDDDNLTTSGTITAANFPAIASDNQILQATGAGTAAWTTDIEGLTSLVVDEITIDGYTITKASSANQLQITSTVSTAGTGYAQYHTCTVDGSRAYGVFYAMTLTPDTGDQARAFQFGMTADTTNGNLAWSIGNFIGLSKSGVNNVTNTAGVYVELISSMGGAMYAFYCFNDMSIASDNMKMLFGAAQDAGIYYDGTDLVANPKLVGTGVLHVLGSITVDDKLNVGYFSFDDAGGGRLSLEYTYGSGSGTVIDVYPTPKGSSTGADYNYIYLWADDTANYELFRIGYDSAGQYLIQNLQGGTGTAYPIRIVNNGKYAINAYSGNGQVVMGSASAVQANSQVEIVGLYQSDAYYNQLHMRTTSNTYGLFAGSASTTLGMISQGSCYNTGGLHRAYATSSSAVWFDTGRIKFLCDTGLTTPGTYTPFTAAMITEDDFQSNVPMRVIGDPLSIESTATYDQTQYKNYFSHNTHAASTVGTMKIRLPHTWKNNWIRYRIRGQTYSTAYGEEGPWEVLIGGYPYSGGPQWIAQSCNIDGNPPFYDVRVGHDGTACCILLGDETTPWSYPRITLDIDCDSYWHTNNALTITPTVDYSSDEAVDWTLTYVEDCPIFIGPHCQMVGTTGTPGSWRLIADKLARNTSVTNNTSATATITAAQIDGTIITSTYSSTGSVNLTLPTGTLMDSYFTNFAVGDSVEWTLINLDDYTLVLNAGTAHTIIGAATIAASTSSKWISRRAAANTWVSYRAA